MKVDAVEICLWTTQLSKALKHQRASLVASTGLTEKEPFVFLREATGLVRSLSAWDLLFLNLVAVGETWSIIYALEYAPLYGGDPVSSLILAAPGVLAILAIYYVFQVSMPRSGGDYVFMSRVLHPSLALGANFVGWTFFLWFWVGDAAAVFSTQGLQQTLSVYGSLTGQQWAIGAASTLSSPTAIFAVGTFAIVVLTALVIFGHKLYFRIQNAFMFIAIIAVVAIIALLATTNSTSFANALNSYASNQGVTLKQGAYQNLTAVGTTYWGGPVPVSPLSGFTFTLIPLWVTVLFWVFSSNYVAGETKRIQKSGMIALFGSFAIIFFSTLGVLGLAYAKLGPEFLAGAGSAAYGYTTNALPVIPNMVLFGGILSNNPLLVWLIGIGVIASILLVAPWAMILMSRILFSYSFDRLAPNWIAGVSDRWHTPVKGILIAAIGGEIFLVFLSGVIGPSNSASAFLLYSYAGLATVGVTFVFVSIAAILFPFRKKDIYERSSPFKRKIAGVPVVTWLGLIGLAYSLGTIGYYSYNYTFYFGAGTLAANYYFFPFIGGMAILFIACMVWYFGISWKYKKSGVPFDKAFKEIPPE